MEPPGAGWGAEGPRRDHLFRTETRTRRKAEREESSTSVTK